MRKLTLIAGALFCALTAPAQASVITTFSCDASARAGANTLTVGPGFPDGGVEQIGNGVTGAEGDSDSFAAVTGYGIADTVDFASGAAVAGDAEAQVSSRTSVVITNDSPFAMRSSFSSLIYAGGVGVALADFNDDTCVFPDIVTCATFLSGPDDISQTAELVFEARLDGETLFSGNIMVGPGGPSAVFDNISLTDFGLVSDNDFFYRWGETSLTDVDLGVFEAGQSKTLEFLISVAVSTTVGAESGRCMFGGPEACAVAQAGFGDPDGNGGGILHFLSSPNPGASPVLSVNFTAVPIPSAFLLFPLGLAALRLRKAKTRG